MTMTGRITAEVGPEQRSFRERVSLCTTSYDLLRLTKQVAVERGFPYFAIVRLPSSKDDKLAQISVLTNWPESLVKAYDEMGLLKSSPMFKALKTSTKPYVWSHKREARHYIKDNDPQIERLFCAHGMCNGVQFSVQEPGGKRGVIGYSGDRAPPMEAELAELSYFSMLVYDRLWELKKCGKAGSPQKLSTRENECLMWTASGKTSAEIAIILKLSEHTVNHYLTAACQKLGATNRAHAVYKAMRAGLLD
ncbi:MULTISPECIES: LuxR family transcriptional regulator [unclassified Roseitalea]|uniref:helix-turn-helix transcriptional regulator n=1 Tax=unclassified Roseitalea TaxID=2639107 RepID=UPI00273FEA05|nr:MULTISPECIES: LuxR family transcriptional regulator [unclassified Roseitalea]